MSKVQFPAIVAFWIATCLLPSTAVLSAAPHYTVTLPEHLDSLTVRACFSASLPNRLITRNERAPGLLRHARLHRQNAVVELRQRSGDQQSLDTALEALQTCCLPADRSWSARELMQKLDQLTESSVFMDLYRQHIDSDEFPDLSAVYAELGLKRVSRTRVDFDPKASAAAIRSAIMTVPES